MLSHEGCEVDAASDLDSALSYLAHDHHDVIIADLYLFGGDDECLLRVVKASGIAAHTPFIVLTGWTTEPHRRLAMELGVDYFLSLPVRPRELMALVSSVLTPAEIGAPRAHPSGDPNDHSIAKGI